MMQPTVDEQGQEGKPAVKLNRIVTPAHIKIMSASMAPAVEPVVAPVPEAQHSDLNDVDTPVEDLEQRSMTALKKLGITAACLTALIIVLLIPWPQSTDGEESALINPIDAPEPNPFLTIGSLVAPLSGGTAVIEVARPASETVAPLPSQPIIATAPGVERVPVVGKPAAELTLAPALSVEEPIEIEKPVIREVEVVSAPTTIAPPNKPRDLVQEVTFSAIAALRSGSGTSTTPVTRTPEDLALFQFVSNARASGRTDVAVDALMNAAHQARSLTVPSKFLLSDGRVNSAAVFAAMLVARQ